MGLISSQLAATSTHFPRTIIDPCTPCSHFWEHDREDPANNHKLSMPSSHLLKNGNNFCEISLLLESCWFSQNDCRQPACSCHLFIQHMRVILSKPAPSPATSSQWSVAHRKTRTKPQDMAFNSLKRSQLCHPGCKERTGPDAKKKRGQGGNNGRTRLGQEMAKDLIRRREKPVRLRLDEKEGWLQKTEEETLIDVVKKVL